MKAEFLGKLGGITSKLRSPSFDGRVCQETFQPSTTACCFVSYDKHSLLKISTSGYSFSHFKKGLLEKRSAAGAQGEKNCTSLVKENTFNKRMEVKQNGLKTIKGIHSYLAVGEFRTCFNSRAVSLISRGVQKFLADKGLHT